MVRRYRPGSTSLNVWNVRAASGHCTLTLAIDASGLAAIERQYGGDEETAQVGSHDDSFSLSNGCPRSVAPPNGADLGGWA